MVDQAATASSEALEAAPCHGCRGWVAPLDQARLIARGQMMNSSQNHGVDRNGLRRVTQVYEGAVLRRSLWQMANSFLPY
jgi:hypothetical protein